MQIEEVEKFLAAYQRLCLKHGFVLIDAATYPAEPNLIKVDDRDQIMRHIKDLADFIDEFGVLNFNELIPF